jgi:hypothetical protein
MKGPAQPLTDSQCLIGAAICGAVTLWLFAGVWFTRLRLGFAWDGTNRKGSAIASLAWSLFTAAFSIVLLASGIHCSPITSRGPWILGLAFLAVVVAFIYDHIGKET